MKTAVIRSSWMDGYGYRLDCQPYLGGALETKLLLESLSLRKDKLYTLTTGFDGGIYNGPKFSRTYVDDPRYGVPFLGGSSMLQADLSHLPLLSGKQAETRLLRHLELKPGMSLISCSGTIGNMVYARKTMVGMWSSQHILKVVPDTNIIPSGYLYAYLSSKFGIPLVVSGTYGSIIKSIGPEHIAELPVPRLSDALERKIHDLVNEAAELRDKASSDFLSAIRQFEHLAGLPPTDVLKMSPRISFVVIQSSHLQERLDTNFHRTYHHDAIRPYIEHKVKGRTVSGIARAIIEPTRFKRIRHDAGDNGVPFFGTGNLGDIDPQPLYRIAPFPDIGQYSVDERTVLIPRSGQIYGLIGTAMQPIGQVLNSAVTEDAIRIVCGTREEAGYVFLALRSEYGLRQLKARCFGGSIPHLDVTNIGQVLIPDLDETTMHQLGEMACHIATLRTQAIEKESLARTMTEDAIQGASCN